MEVFLYSLQNPEQPWAAIEARVLAEQQAAYAARYPEQPHQHSPLMRAELSSRQHDGRGVLAARTASARLSEQFQMSRPVTARELIAGLHFYTLAEQEPQQRQGADPAYGGSARLPNGHPQAGAAALGVFADCSSCDEDDMDMLQAAMEAEAQLGIQHGLADTPQVPHRYSDHRIGSEEDILLAPGGYTAPDTAMPWDGQPNGEAYGAWRGALHHDQDAPDIIFEGSDLDRLQAEAQPAWSAQPEGSMRLAAPLAHSSSSEAEEADAQDWHTASSVRSKGPFAEGASDDFIFCDDQEEGNHTDEPANLAHQRFMHSSDVPQPLHGTGHASLAENSFGTTPGCLQHYASPEIENGQSFRPYANFSAYAENGDTGDEEIQMATDEVAHPSKASSLKSDEAAAFSEPAAADVLIMTDSRELNMQPEVVTDQPEEEHGMQAQAEWGEEDDDSQDIIFDDAAVDFAAQWMHAADSNELQADNYLDTPMGSEQQRAPGSSVATETRRKRAREELRDKLIQVCAYQLIPTVHTSCSNTHKRRPERMLCMQQSLIFWVRCRSFWRTKEGAASWSR